MIDRETDKRVNDWHHGQVLTSLGSVGLTVSRHQNRTRQTVAGSAHAPIHARAHAAPSRDVNTGFPAVSHEPTHIFSTYVCHERSFDRIQITVVRLGRVNPHRQPFKSPTPFSGLPILSCFLCQAQGDDHLCNKPFKPICNRLPVDTWDEMWENIDGCSQNASS